MTDPPGDDRNAVDLDGDFLTVEQMAQLRRVTPAAIRAQLRAGSLAGEQVLQGQRTVWRIPVSAARQRPGGTSTQAGTGPSETSAGPRASARPTSPVTPPEVAPTRPAPAPARPASAAPTPAPAAAPARVEVLEAEVRRLRRQLSALAEAHRRLLDALTADLADDSAR